MKIQTKFNIGNNVFRGFIDHVKLLKKCRFCGGQGNVIIIGKIGKKEDYQCPKCEGNGQIEKYELVPMRKIKFAISAMGEYIISNTSYFLKWKMLLNMLKKN